VLLGEDQALGRSVMLWLRSPAEAPLSPARRECGRPTRLRWLACGRQEEWQWDAFLAPAGQPLAGLVASGGRLSWGEVRPLLGQLAEELAAADAEGTLPGRLGVDQVWVHPGGEVQLLDVPLRREPAPGAGDAAGPSPALTLLAQTAVLALEGQPRVRADSVQAPLPDHVVGLLDRLLGKGKPYQDVQEFQTNLRATYSLPAEVTRGRRTGHVAALAAFLFVGLCCCMMPAGWVGGFQHLLVFSVQGHEARRVLRGLEDQAARDFTAGVFVPQPLARPAAVSQLAADLQLRDRYRQKLEADERAFEARKKAASSLTRWLLQWMNQSMEQELTREPRTREDRFQDFRADARREVDHPMQPRELNPFLGIAALVQVIVWPILWVISALIFRGGLSYHMLGLSLVRRDGRPARELRCAWRAVLVWAPLTALLLAVVWLDAWYWSLPEASVAPGWLLPLAEALRWTSLGLLLAYPVVAIGFPRRGPHDWLAGTYLVPR
jgi:hypothetical protein